jgi:hypothetical protein
MKLTMMRAALMALTVLGASQAFADTPGFSGTTTAEFKGYVTHGVNVYNGKPIGDYRRILPSVTLLHANPLVAEIGVYQAGKALSAEITDKTDRSLPVATTRGFLDFFVPNQYVNPAWLNVPLGQIGSVPFGGSSITDRVLPEAFPTKAQDPSIYHRRGTVTNPTVAEWEKISGLLTAYNRPDGTSRIKITIRNAFPNSLYTLWDIGAKKPQTREESVYAVPLGGVPNTISTDERGCMTREIDLPYHVNRQCVLGASSCTAYISAFYHWDGHAYGASPDVFAEGLPIGVVGSNQILFAPTGELLQEPHTEMKPARHGCPLI